MFEFFLAVIVFTLAKFWAVILALPFVFIFFKKVLDWCSDNDSDTLSKGVLE